MVLGLWRKRDTDAELTLKHDCTQAARPVGGPFCLCSAARNMAFIADRQGTTLAAVHPSGLRDETAAYFGRNVFGTLEGASGTGSSSNPETGFTGASTPNQTGGFTFLRNRWYDAQSGRFLTQDPIGLAGGVNLYAYAGNNPVSFSDPYGLRADSLKVNGSMSQKAVTWLMANSPTARKTLEAIAGDDRVSLTIRDPISSVEAGTGEMLFAPEGSTKGTILLNPVGTNQANFDLPQGSSWIHTVASDLAHEIGHAAGHFGHASSACAGDPAPGGTGCIINYENKVRQELTGGSGGGVRTEY
jgi:RHS repeat-associated protein